MDIYENDTLYDDSPNTGDPKCLCSRCRRIIPEEWPAIRMWPTVDDEVTHYEYRYCEDCFNGKIRRIPKPEHYKSHFIVHDPEPTLIINLTNSNFQGQLQLGASHEEFEVTEDGNDFIITLID